MSSNNRGNYRLQLRAFGIGLIIALIASVFLVLSGLISWPIAIGIVIAVFLFEVMYFFILRDRSPEPLTQVNMRKDIDYSEEEGDKQSAR